MGFCDVLLLPRDVRRSVVIVVFLCQVCQPECPSLNVVRAHQTLSVTWASEIDAGRAPSVIHAPTALNRTTGLDASNSIGWHSIFIVHFPEGCTTIRVRSRQVQEIDSCEDDKEAAK